ncbi:hypothetical protein LEP1GSC133_3222 [Leptospira borgpetersenii serovar Pomona str. 200901868]|uniref:Uncharacterized protein n=1 Tax=Leptospira borgpetersenii serovar Pomona str. 200901868 TaxID=1192866 RepID=M6W6V2_LEPBO|nr:hypothetical protein LEP1GSC133_3222 [Leptospira borgpetersenii serovar Pomona str. 200901868]
MLASNPRFSSPEGRGAILSKFFLEELLKENQNTKERFLKRKQIVFSS